MKFFSRHNNYRVVLRPGIPREPMTGREAVPGIHVKFENGVANVNNPGHIEMMLQHPAFNVDYIAEDSPELDSFKKNLNLKEIEPVHTIAEMKYGHMENVQNPKPVGVAKDPVKIKEIQDIAAKITTEMLAKKEGEMRKQIIQDIKDGKISLDDVPEAPAEENGTSEVPEIAEAPESTEEDSVQVVDEDSETFEKKELHGDAEVLNQDEPLPENPNTIE